MLGVPSRRVWLRRGRLGLIGAFFFLPLCIVGWSVLKSFDPDEIEAVHTAWKMMKGERVYVDFFQHHHPLLYAYLAPIIANCGELSLRRAGPTGIHEAEYSRESSRVMVRWIPFRYDYPDGMGGPEGEIARGSGAAQGLG